MTDSRLSLSLLPHCRPCRSRCCRYSSPIVGPEERDRIVDATGRDYFEKVQTPTGSYFVIGRRSDGTPRAIDPEVSVTEDPCSYLASDGTCSIQALKPLDCVVYPLRAVPRKDGGMDWRRHGDCPAAELLTNEFQSTALRLAEASARRFHPQTFRHWLERFSRWTLAPASVLPESPAASALGEADAFMAAEVAHVAAARPDLCDRSGRGFWPAPAVFPRLLTRCLDALQERITALYLAGERYDAGTLVKCRVALCAIGTCGDVGEDHADLFLRDHPSAGALNAEQAQDLPFAGFCQAVLAISDAIELVGVLTRNEEGSLGEMKALVAHSLIKEGPYSARHLAEEPEHARRSREVSELVTNHPRFGAAFRRGRRFHDELYRGLTM